MMQALYFCQMQNAMLLCSSWIHLNQTKQMQKQLLKLRTR